MLNFRTKNFFSYIIANMISAAISFAGESLPLDLVGDRNTATIQVAFKYYEPQPDDCLTLIHQGGYKAYNITDNQSHVAVIGPLSPCVGMVITDSVKLLAFHKHSTNSFLFLKSIIETNLDLSNKDNLYARIYTCRHDKKWVNQDRKTMHNGKTHGEEVRAIWHYLINEIGVNPKQIRAQMWDLLDNQGNEKYLSWADGKYNKIETKYEMIQSFIAVRLNEVLKETDGAPKEIKLFSIDPFNEDVFNFEGKKFFLNEYLEPEDFERIVQSFPGVDLNEAIQYRQLPKLFPYGYILQRKICKVYFDGVVKINYLKTFGRTWEDGLFEGKEAYNTLNFYSID